jgi:hypothetical protein
MSQFLLCQKCKLFVKMDRCTYENFGADRILVFFDWKCLNCNAKGTVRRVLLRKDVEDGAIEQVCANMFALR